MRDLHRCDCPDCEHARATTPPADLVTLGDPSFHLPAMLADIYRGAWSSPSVVPMRRLVDEYTPADAVQTWLAWNPDEVFPPALGDA